MGIRCFRVGMGGGGGGRRGDGANVLLPPDAKRVELINFSGPKLSFWRHDSADCKQCGTK